MKKILVAACISSSLSVLAASTYNIPNLHFVEDSIADIWKKHEASFNMHTNIGMDKHNWAGVQVAWTPTQSMIGQHYLTRIIFEGFPTERKLPTLIKGGLSRRYITNSRLIWGGYGLIAIPFRGTSWHQFPLLLNFGLERIHPNSWFSFVWDLSFSPNQIKKLIGITSIKIGRIYPTWEIPFSLSVQNSSEIFIQCRGGIKGSLKSIPGFWNAFKFVTVGIGGTYNYNREMPLKKSNFGMFFHFQLNIPGAQNNNDGLRNYLRMPIDRCFNPPFRYNDYDPWSDSPSPSDPAKPARSTTPLVELVDSEYHDSSPEQPNLNSNSSSHLNYLDRDWNQDNGNQQLPNSSHSNSTPPQSTIQIPRFPSPKYNPQPLEEDDDKSSDTASISILQPLDPIPIVEKLSFPSEPTTPTALQSNDQQGDDGLPLIQPKSPPLSPKASNRSMASFTTALDKSEQPKGYFVDSETPKYFPDLTN
jgi:hypothetical protein